MELLLILIYSSICIFIFKVFHIPSNKWTVPTAILGGVVMVASMLLLMNYNHPYTKYASQYYVSTPIIPNVKGRVIEVNGVKPNELVKQGDILFKIDPTPFQAAVDQYKAALSDAENSVAILEADYKASQARLSQSQLIMEQKRKEYERYRKLLESKATSASNFEVKEREYTVSKADYEASQADLKKYELQYNSRIHGEHTKVAQAKAMLEQAQYNLDETVVRAPTNGFVVQNLLKPGMMANTLPFRPVMTFTHQQDRLFIGAFRQNSLLRLKIGDPAEFVFPSIPGETFQGEVFSILPAMGENELQANGTLYVGKHFLNEAMPLVIFKLNSDISEHNLPYGANVEIAVYTEHLHHLSTMRKILLRMNSWKNYLYLDH